MKHFPTFLLLALLLSLATELHAIELTLTSPLEHQVVHHLGEGTAAHHGRTVGGRFSRGGGSGPGG